MSLYTDNIPKYTIKCLGFSSEDAALNTLKLIEKRSILYQKTTINAMFYRAKHHPNKNKDIKKAMKIFSDWLKKNKNKQRKYDYLCIDVVKKYIPDMDDKTFIKLYIKYGKRKMSFIPINIKNPKIGDYDSYREKMIDKHVPKCKKLYNKDGTPTTCHIKLMSYAYSPDKNIKK